MRRGLLRRRATVSSCLDTISAKGGGRADYMQPLDPAPFALHGIGPAGWASRIRMPISRRSAASATNQRLAVETAAQADEVDERPAAALSPGPQASRKSARCRPPAISLCYRNFQGSLRI
jgi:hypothetical protein